MTNVKKVIFLAAILAGLAGTAYFFLGFPVRDDQPQAPSIEAVTNERVVSPISSYGNDAIWFANTQGNLFRMDTLTRSITEYPLPPIFENSLDSIIWPWKGNDFIAVTDGPGDSFAKRYYNNADRTYTILPGNVRSLDWLENGRQIGMVWKSDDGTNKLMVANPDATGFTILRDLPWEDLIVQTSPKRNEALLVKQGVDGPVNKVYLFDLQTGEYQELVSEGVNLAADWSPDGEHFIYISLVDNKPKLFYKSLDSDAIHDLGIEVSVLEKVAFADQGRSLYVVESNSSGDSIIHIDLNDFSRKSVPLPTQSSYIKSLLYVSGQLYFVSSADGKLYLVQ